MPTRDLSHPLDADTWTYPADPPISIESHATIDADGYRVSALSLGTHAGTHLDAPSHTEPDGTTVADLPVETFSFDAVLVRLDSAVCDRESIDRDVLPTIPDEADLLVLHTGWAAHWGTDRYLDHPYLAPDAARWCADRDLSVAIDAPSVDPFPAANAAVEGPTGHPAHHTILGSGLVIVENLTRLDDVPERFRLRAYPLPLAEADGSPVRAVAVI